MPLPPARGGSETYTRSTLVAMGWAPLPIAESDDSGASLTVSPRSAVWRFWLPRKMPAHRDTVVRALRRPASIAARHRGHSRSREKISCVPFAAALSCWTLRQDAPVPVAAPCAAIPPCPTGKTLPPRPSGHIRSERALSCSQNSPSHGPWLTTEIYPICRPASRLKIAITACGFSGEKAGSVQTTISGRPLTLPHQKWEG